MCHFQWPSITFNTHFKVTPLFNADLKNGTRQWHSCNGILHVIGTYTHALLDGVILNDLDVILSDLAMTRSIMQPLCDSSVNCLLSLYMRRSQQLYGFIALISFFSFLLFFIALGTTFWCADNCWFVSHWLMNVRECHLARYGVVTQSHQLIAVFIHRPTLYASELHAGPNFGTRPDPTR